MMRLIFANRYLIADIGFVLPRNAWSKYCAMLELAVPFSDTENYTYNTLGLL